MIALRPGQRSRRGMGNRIRRAGSRTPPRESTMEPKVMAFVLRVVEFGLVAFVLTLGAATLARVVWIVATRVWRFL